VAPRTVPIQLVLITSSLPPLSSGTNPLPPQVGHRCSESVPFSMTPSPLQSGQVFCVMGRPVKFWDVRFGSKADLCSAAALYDLPPNADICRARANSGLMQGIKRISKSGHRGSQNR